MPDNKRMMQTNLQIKSSNKLICNFSETWNIVQVTHLKANLLSDTSLVNVPLPFSQQQGLWDILMAIFYFF